MGCCGNNDKCNKRQPLHEDRQREEFTGLNAFGFLILNALLDVARTGKTPKVPLDSVPAAQDLAETITKLVLENDYLKKLMSFVDGESSVVVTPDTFKISFGPAGEYALTIPIVTDDARRQLIANLTAAIATLQEKNSGGKQLNLFAPQA